MKLATKLIAAATIAIVSTSAFAASDSYLYWMVDNPVNLISGEDTTFDYAMVKAGDNYLNWYQYDGISSVSQGTKLWANEDGRSTEAAYWGTFDYAPGMNFLFELYNEDGSVAGFLNTPWVSFASIASGTSASGATAYNLTGVVPEPTSGLLALFGLAALALRRRRMA